MTAQRRLMATIYISDEKVFEASGYDEAALKALLLSKCEQEGTGAYGEIKCLKSHEVLLTCRKSPVS